MFVERHEDGVVDFAVAPGQHRPPTRQDGAPEGEAAVVVDGVVGLGEEGEVHHGGGEGGGGEVREEDPLVYEMVLAPVNVVTSHQEHGPRVLSQELLDAKYEKLLVHSRTLESLFNEA